MLTASVSYGSTCLYQEIVVNPENHALNCVSGDIHSRHREDGFSANITNIFETEPLEWHNINCSTRVITDKEHLKEYLETLSNYPRHCTLDYFKQYLLENKRFLGDGVWFAPPNGTPSREADFYPKGCVFSQRLSDADVLSRCFVEKGVKNILVTGDSNSLLLKQSILNYFQDFKFNGGQSCEVLASGDSDGAYFAVPSVAKNLLKVKLRSRKSICVLHNNYSVILERVAMLHILDGSLHIEQDENMLNIFFPRVLHAETRLEYLLKYYFPHVGFPDLWLFTLPFHHESWGNTIGKMRIDLRYMLDMMELYLPSTTTVVFVADARECPEFRPPAVADDFERFWNKTRNEQIHDLNQVLYEVLWQRLSHVKTMYGFLDADKITCPLQCSWHSDGAHMKSEWYIKMARYILESFCEDIYTFT